MDDITRTIVDLAARVQRLEDEREITRVLLSLRFRRRHR